VRFCINAPNASILTVSEIDIVLFIHRKPVRTVDQRLASGTSIATEAFLSRAGESRDDAGSKIDGPDPLVPSGEEKISAAVHGESAEVGEAGVHRPFAITASTLFSISCDRRNHAGARIDAPDALIERIADDQFPTRA
jgi:hypothetical protein